MDECARPFLCCCHFPATAAERMMERGWFALQSPRGCWHSAAAQACWRLIVAHRPLLGRSPKRSEHHSLLCCRSRIPGRWLVVPVLVPGVCVPPAVFSMPRCFLLQVLTPCRSGKGTELSRSLLSASTMHSEFLQASGKCFFPYKCSSSCTCQ